MIPPLIVRKALEYKLDLIAITDHNASENASAVIRAAKGTSLTVLPGMELETKEEVHCLCLFDTLGHLEELQTLVDNTLPDVPNNIDFFGEQFIVDHTGDFIKRKERLLLNSTTLTFEEAYQSVKKLGGLFIPAHVTRKGFGLLPHLGFVPTTTKPDALEISRHMSPQKAISMYPELKNYPLIQNGDVHFIDDFLGATTFKVEKPTVQELQLALKHKNGRNFTISSVIG
jgi:PHP family Zn ribbon phosphoesterase